MEDLLENAAATAQTNANDSSSNTRPTVMSVAEFCKMKHFVELIPKVRVNANEYPFITFITGPSSPLGANKAENIYFTVNASENVHEGQDLREIAHDLQIVVVSYTDGRESRAKISRKSSSRLTIEDLF